MVSAREAVPWNKSQTPQKSAKTHNGQWSELYSKGEGSEGFSTGSEGKSPPAKQDMWERQVQSPGQEDPLEDETASHPSILAGKIPRAEPGKL